ncbi:unnamed protein product, partial [Thlaspi arvense]
SFTTYFSPKPHQSSPPLNNAQPKSQKTIHKSMDNNNQQSFWQFSDQLRVQTPQNLANLSLNDSIWSTNSVYKRNDERRNLDNNHVEYLNQDNNNNYNKTGSDISWNSWKSSSNDFGPVGSKFRSNEINGDFNKGIYSSPVKTSYGIHQKSKGVIDEDHHHQIPKGGGGKKNRKNQNHNHQRSNEDNNGGLDKRFKTLPPAEALPRNETIGGYIFVCNNDTMEENLKRQLFGLPPRYRDSVRAITPGLPLFLYNYSTHQLHGIYQAASFGGTNIELSAFEDKKCPGESRFPAQVRAITRKVCLPLEEDSFRPILHHYDGPKFRLELSVPEVLSLLDIFAEQNP